MARITHVKHARQRYAMVPVLDSEGQPVKIALTKNGAPQKTKHGREVTITKSVQDRTRPLPMPKCDAPNCRLAEERDGDKTIRPGEAYKHISPKTGPYGGRTLTRHEVCPTWNRWEYNYSTASQIERITHEADLDVEWESEDDAQSTIDEIVSEAEALLDEKQSNLDNLPEAFQQSGDLYEQVEALQGWVDELQNVSIPELPEAEPKQVWYVNGPDGQSLNEEGYETEDEAQNALDVYADENPDEDMDEWAVESEDSEEEGELTDEQWADWREETRDAIRDALDSCQL